MARIGEVRASRREVDPARASGSMAGASAFVGELSELGSAYVQQSRLGMTSEDAQSNLALAVRNREEKVTGARLTSELIGIQNQLSRDLLDAYDAAPAGHQGFDDSIRAGAETRLNEFMARVPERLRPQFEPDLARIRESLTNTAFELRTKSENAEFSRTVRTLTVDVVDSLNEAVITSPDDLDAIEAEAWNALDKMLANSPLDAASTRQVREELDGAIKSAKLGRLVLEEALDNMNAGGAVPGSLQQRGDAVYSERPVASGLSAWQVGLLQAISGKESGGEYNVMYSPDGRRYFSDFAAHPNQPEVIASGPHAGQKSSAAGRYQFIKSTWEAAARELGLADFSPENQDLAALHTAAKDYYAATGRDLSAVIASGHAPSIIAAKKVLEGTWEGLKNMSDADFVNMLAGATGNPSSLLYDEEFGNIPFDERMAIATDALAKSDQVRAEMAAEREAQRNRALEQLRFGIESGEMGMNDILKQQSVQGFSFDQTQALITQFEKKNEMVIAAAAGAAMMDDPAASFDPSNADDRKKIDALFESTQATQKILNGDSDYIDSVVAPVAEKFGYVAPGVVTQLQSQMQSSDPKAAAFALETISKLDAVSGRGAVDALGKQAVAAANLYNAARGYMPEDQLMRFIRGDLLKEDLQLFEVRDQQVRTNMKDDPDAFTAAGISDMLGISAPKDFLQGAAMLEEYLPLYRYNFTLTGNHRQAKDLTAKMMGKYWGEMEYDGESYTIKHPPSQFYPAFNGSHDWIEMELKKEVPTGRVELVSDPQTEAEVAAGRLPTYSLVKMQDGFMVPLRMRDLASYDPMMDVLGSGEIGNQPVRYMPELSETTRQEILGTLGPTVVPAPKKGAASTNAGIRQVATQVSNPETARQLARARTDQDRIAALEAAKNGARPELRAQIDRQLAALGVSIPPSAPMVEAPGLPAAPGAEATPLLPGETSAPQTTKAPLFTTGPAKFNERDQKTLSAFVTITKDAGLYQQLLAAPGGEARHGIYKQMIDNLNRQPPSPAVLELRRQIAILAWRTR